MQEHPPPLHISISPDAHTFSRSKQIARIRYVHDASCISQPHRLMKTGAYATVLVESRRMTIEPTYSVCSHCLLVRSMICSKRPRNYGSSLRSGTNAGGVLGKQWGIGCRLFASTSFCIPLRTKDGGWRSNADSLGPAIRRFYVIMSGLHLHCPRQTTQDLLEITELQLTELKTAYPQGEK